QSMGANSQSYLRQYAVALTMLQHGFGVSGQFGRQLQALQTALGEDTNSLLTVTKVARNSLRVRFGATQQLSSGLALVPRNHTVTLVVFVPRSSTYTASSSDKQGLTCAIPVAEQARPQRIRVTSRTELVDATATLVETSGKNKAPAIRTPDSTRDLLKNTVAA